MRRIGYKSTIIAAAAAVVMLGTVPVSAGQKGLASWYQSGKRTANGERFNPNGLTAAHRTLPFGSRVRVTNLRNGRSVVVRINDRGPFIRKRIIDLARGAANRIGLRKSGVAPVRIVVLSRG